MKPGRREPRRARRWADSGTRRRPVHSGSRGRAALACPIIAGDSHLIRSLAVSRAHAVRPEGEAEGWVIGDRRVEAETDGEATRPLSGADVALLSLLEGLAEEGYQFLTPGPNTYRRLRLLQGRREAANLQDVFGWNLPFRPGAIPARLVALARAGGILAQRGSRCAVRLAVARLGDLLFLHSPIPARDANHVFFGPDSYRFAHFIDAEVPAFRPGARILDLGCGAGVGGLVAARRAAHVRLTLSDINPKALRLAGVNAAFARQTPDLIACDGRPLAAGPFDLIVANPPYISGSGLTYSDGGKARGAELSLAWARSSLSALAPGGRLLLYSGSAIVRGADPLRRELQALAEAAGASFRYGELDPDVFPATLLNPGYWGVDRIAAVGAVLVKRS